MKRILIYGLLLPAIISAIYSFNKPVEEAGDLQPSPLPKDSVLQLVKEGYIYAYPLVQSYRTFLAAADNAAKGKLKLNQFYFADKLAAASNDNAQKKAALHTTKNRSGAGPNNDTPYFFSTLDFSDGAIVLHIPAHKERYFSLQFVDLYQDNVLYIGTRNGDTEEANYLLSGPRWKGEVPKNIKKHFRFAADYASVIGRTLVNDDKDLPVVNKLQHAINLTPLNEWPAEQGKYTGFVHTGLPVYYDSPDSFIVNVNNALKLAPPHQYDVKTLQRLSLIGISKGKDINYNLPAGIAAADIKEAITEADQQIENDVPSSFVAVGNNWTRTPPQYGHFESNHLLKASNIRLGGWGGHSQEEAFYLFPKYDSNGDSLTGGHKYVIHFDKGKLPPVKSIGFWSLTAYEMPGFFLIPNSLNRYAIRDRTTGLKYNADGSLDIYLQVDDPGADKQSNWLPVSKEAFTVCFRVYIPQPELITGAYKFPFVKRID